MQDVPTPAHLRAIGQDLAEIVHADAVAHAQWVDSLIDGHRSKAASLVAICAPASIGIMVYMLDHHSTSPTWVWAAPAAGLAIASLFGVYATWPVDWRAPAPAMHQWFQVASGPRAVQEVSDTKTMLMLMSTAISNAARQNIARSQQIAWATKVALSFAALSAVIGLLGFCLTSS